MTRFETTTVELFAFSELDSEAREVAVSERMTRNAEDPIWCDEWRDSLTGGADAFGLTIQDWRVDPWGASYVTMAADWEGLCLDYGYGGDEPTGVRLWKLLGRVIREWEESSGKVMLNGGGCPFTGYCGDENFLDPLREFMSRPKAGVDFETLMGECCDSWAKGYASDLEWQAGEERARDELEMEEAEEIAMGGDPFMFLESGKRG